MDENHGHPWDQGVDAVAVEKLILSPRTRIVNVRRLVTASTEHSQPSGKFLGGFYATRTGAGPQNSFCTLGFLRCDSLHPRSPLWGVFAS